jgi:hypothetical protein
MLLAETRYLPHDDSGHFLARDTDYAKARNCDIALARIHHDAFHPRSYPARPAARKREGRVFDPCDFEPDASNLR